MTNKTWFVIEKSNYGGNTYSYRIEKTANTVDQATKFKVHLDALNDSKNKSYFLASDIDTVMERVISLHNKSVEDGSYYEQHPEIEKPLILDNEVKEKDTSEEIPF